MIKTRTIPVLLGLVLVAAACGGSDAETVPPTAAPTTTTTIAATTTTAALLPAPDADIIAFTEAFGVGDSDTAWSYVSARCGGGGSVPVGYVQAVDDYAAAYPGATAVIVGGEVGDNDTALITYDVHDGSGEFAQSYDSQQWAFVDGKWYRDACTTASSETTTPTLQSDLGAGTPFGAGTYTMGDLGTPVTFKVSGEWMTQPVGPGYFVITTPDSVGPGDHDLVFLRSAALFSAGGEPVLAADDLEGWLATVPDTASVSEPTPTTVAGLDAVTFEVTAESEVPLLLAGAEGTEFFKGFQPGFLYEVLWIDQPDGQPIVVVTGTPEDDPDWLDVARGVVATLEIG